MEGRLSSHHAYLYIGIILCVHKCGLYIYSFFYWWFHGGVAARWLDGREIYQLNPKLVTSITQPQSISLYIYQFCIWTRYHGTKQVAVMGALGNLQVDKFLSVTLLFQKKKKGIFFFFFTSSKAQNIFKLKIEPDYSRTVYLPAKAYLEGKNKNKDSSRRVKPNPIWLVQVLIFF